MRRSVAQATSNVAEATTTASVVTSNEASPIEAPTSPYGILIRSTFRLVACPVALATTRASVGRVQATICRKVEVVRHYRRK